MPDTDTPKPHPAHPVRRECDLPWTCPKPDRDDPRASGMVGAILRSPEYRQADEDVDFLHRYEMRGLRLHLDFDKAESLLTAQGIAHSIVVIGSTRVPEPEAARRALAAFEADRTQAGATPEIERRVRIARRVLDKSRFYEIAQDFGRIVGRSEGPNGQRLALVTGGGPGMMEAANRGAHDVCARTVGLNITLPHEQYPNPYLTPGLCLRFHYFAIRKLHFLKRARALVVFPGGFGTLDELFETLTLIQTRKIAPVPVILVGETFWRGVFDPEFLVDEGVIDPEDRDLFWFAESAQEIWEDIQRWYDRCGRSLTG
ncbi:TIGR00730 family Rossman fold protein [Salipiger mucosus]|uniref:AMP nucleosidase n=1 Tax=Salipiger mucosus DSM 16094 TaxID=1123237 RepID=S9QZ70_9RHOB|nr:TIGR00730 family Rossman fold protein [Salipiger mucosus]EPX84963.1 hypothetical protein Salmuc_00560 [Salipiger mucosus DSM 16094]